MLGQANSTRDSKPKDTKRRPDITVQLMARFKELIAEGILIPGCKLPAERVLSQRLGVSRPSLRQALKVMQIMEVLEQKVGDGTYLRGNASAILSEPMDFLVLLDSISYEELFTARLIAEPELAARAAERATSEDLARMRQALTSMKRYRTDASRVVAADLAFHDAIFQAAGSRVCQSIFRLIHRMLMREIARSARLVSVPHTLRFHTAIYEAIDRRNQEEARRRMAEHLADAEGVLMRLYSARRAASPDLIRPLDRYLRVKPKPRRRAGGAK